MNTIPGKQLIDQWTPAKLLWFRFIAIFVLLFMLTLSFPHPYIPDLPGMIAPVFEKLVGWTATHILNLKQPYTTALISDSTGLYIHVFILLIISFISGITWGFLSKRQDNASIMYAWFRTICSYYLAFHLLIYGFNKVFKWQFYLPEPNTLFTTMGNTYRDLLYWSTMGTSHSYNMFMGLLEVLAAILLLFRRTRLAGALAAWVILLNVVMVNFSFDISVKLYSLFLLLLASLIIAPDLRRLYYFLFTDHVCARSVQPYLLKRYPRIIYILLKSAIILIIAISSLSVYVRSGNFNDDTAARPLFHGAYDVTTFVRNNDTLLPLTTDTYRWQRLFIHRRGYLVIQNMQGEMQDYSFDADTTNRNWNIRDELTANSASLQYYRLSADQLKLNGRVGVDSIAVLLKKIDLTRLPLMQKEFNWTVD